MRIYVACLASYNNGILHGAWIDMDGTDRETVDAEIAAMLRESPEPSAEEYAVHDYDGIPARFGEYPDLDKVIAYCDALSELEGDEREAFALWADHRHDEGYQEAPTADAFRDAYAGRYASWREFAEHVVEESALLEGVPENVARYFDYEAYGSDLRIGGDVDEFEGHYFWSR